ncbi:hypothetical protein KC19_VG121400 [Ceratodon purpureus]|uniref:Uncharacterized protein n=1 Tax=Ceratodon purpureus TaxID=3225 RepID=A0A8T0HQ84_CERPU|nr:hypothetical protein KC19_VG121400 [Ceratodon purpureus]
MNVDPIAAEAMAEVGVETHVAADILDHVVALDAESSSEVDNAEKVLELLVAEVQVKVAYLNRDTQRSKEEMIEDLGRSHKHAETSSKESVMELNFVIEVLKQELRRLEEENQLLRSSSNESRYSVYNVLQENAHVEVEGNNFGLENQENEEQLVDRLIELETLKTQMQVADDSHARLVYEKVALRQEREGEISSLSSQIIAIEIQFHELEEEHSSGLERSKALESNLDFIDDKKIKLKDQVTSILEGWQHWEEEPVGTLETCQEKVRKQQNLLSTIETSSAAVRQLEVHDAAVSSEFELENHLAQARIADLASKLQISQDQQYELQLQLHGLREENTHVVMKASKLNQEVDELKFDIDQSQFEALVQEKERREELEVELRTCRGHIQSFEAEKLASVIMVDSLITQVRELEEDKRQLSGLSNEASLSVQHLWEENNRLIEGYSRLEQEKQALEGERMELVAGIQTVWEQLHAANERETLLASNLRELNERKDAEAVLLDQKVKDLEIKLEVLEKENIGLHLKSEEMSQLLGALRQETSQKLKDLQEEKDQLLGQASELVKQKKKTEQAVSAQQIFWEMQVQGLVSERATALSTVEDLEQLLHASKEEVKDLKEKVEKSNQLILELQEEIIRLSGEVDKLEEVKERQEGERLELAADLQAAWDQIQAVRDSEATLATELSELKDLRNEEKLRSDELVQKLRWHLNELEERISEAGIKVYQLSKRLTDLRKEQELQDENERLEAGIVILEQEKGTILTEKVLLQVEVQSLQGRVEVLELDKIKMAFEIEELNQWLQGPAAEKKQLAANLDELTRLLQGIQLERTQLTISVRVLQEEKERIQKDVVKSQDMINVLEKEKAKTLLVHEESIRQLKSLQEEKQQALRSQEVSALLMQNLNEKIHLLEGELTRMNSVHENSRLRVQTLEEEKSVMERLLEVRSFDLGQLRLKNIERVDALDKLEGELELKQIEVQLLNYQVLSLEEESSSMKRLHKSVHSQLQALEIEKSQAGILVVSLGEEKSQLLQLLEGSELRMQGLMQRNSELCEPISRLEADLMKRSEEILETSGLLSDVEEDKENFLSQHKEPLENLQAENLKHINRAVLREDRMVRTQVELQRYEDHIKSLSTVHQDALLQLQALAEEKVELTNACNTLNSYVQKLQPDNFLNISNAEFSEGELERTQTEIQGIQETLLQPQNLEEAEAELVQSLGASNFIVHGLQGKNVKYTNPVKIFEEEVALRQGELQRLETKAGRLPSVHQEWLLELEVLNEEKAELVNSLDVFNSSDQELLVENDQRTNSSKTVEVEVALRQPELVRLDQETERLSAAHHDSRFQKQNLEGEKAESVKSLVFSNLLIWKLQVENFEYTSRAVSLEIEMERRKSEVHELGETIKNLSIVNQNLLLQLHTLEEKAELEKSLDESVQELQERIDEKSESDYFLEKEEAERQAEIRRLKEPERLSSAHQVSLFQLEVLKVETDESLSSFDTSNSSIRVLHEKNEQHVNTIKTLEDEVARRSAKVQRLEGHTKRLLTTNQSILLQLQAFAEENYVLALDASNLSVLKLQAQTSEYFTLINSLEEEIKRRQAHVQDMSKVTDCLSTEHEDILLQLLSLKEEKVKLVKRLDASKSSFQELLEKNVEYSERIKFFKEGVAQEHADVRRLEVESESLSTTHDNALLQLQGLGAEILAITNLILKLHTKNSELASAARKIQQDLYRRRVNIESLDSLVHRLDDSDFRKASKFHGVLLRVPSLEGVADVAMSVEGCSKLVEQDFNGEMFMKMKCSKLPEQSELMLKKLEMKNVELSTTVSKLERHLLDKSQIFRDRVQILEVERESFEQECIAKFHCLEEEKSELEKALKESNLANADVQTVLDYLKVSVLDLGRGKDELANQLRLLQEQACVIVAERDQLSSEMQVMREQLLEYLKRLLKLENVAIKSKEEALELAEQLENFREQLPEQVACLPMRNGDLVTELEPVLDRERMPFGQLETSHLIGANIDPREELQQASLGWVEIITTVCKKLAKLLRSVGDEKEKLARKQGMSHQKIIVLTNLCQELDRLILGVTEKTERFAEELSLLNHKLVKSTNDRFSLGSDAGPNVVKNQMLPTLVAPENREYMLVVETSCQTLQSNEVDKIELEAHVANLSSCLADSQGQLKALVIKSSSGNPYLLTSRADDGGYRKGLACFSGDDYGVLCYESEVKVERNIKALDKDKKVKKGITTLPSFSQRTQISGRSFKKCKLNIQPPKRRWIF